MAGAGARLHAEDRRGAGVTAPRGHGPAAIEIGRIEAIFRYPVKSMRGEPLDGVSLGFHGVDGDRRMALRRLEDRGGFPWLTAGKLPDLIAYAPLRRGTEGGGAAGAALPTHVRTPDGEELDIFGEALAGDVGKRHGGAVQMTHLTHGIFDDATVSVIAAGTVDELGRLSGRPADVRRFRPNVLVRTTTAVPFEEDGWVGGVLAFGEAADAAAVAITMPDIRCGMVNLDPDGGPATPEVLKAVVRANQNRAGVYGTVTRAGRLTVGQAVVLHRAPLAGLA
jgi:uncharacterized protein